MALLPPRGRALSVMTANLRYPARDRHPWAQRLPAWIELLTEEAPHVIGTQEGTIEQLDALVDALPARYAWTGEGRAGGNAGEFTAVIFDAQRLDARAVDVRWISETPDVPGSRSWGSSHPRTITTVDLRDRVGGHALRFINVHVDHRSEKARPHAARMLRALAAEGLDDGAQVIITGDFNVDQHHDLHRLLVADGLVSDAVDASEADVTDADVDTFHFYRGVKRGGRRIDWILHSPGLRPLAVAPNTSEPGGVFPSDHYPVQARLAWARDALRSE
ncbi:MAG TPA: endonuclease/exonuclease/phosphatase family protein [Candidatus Brevibacterium intestinigallinarum]|nr:endonuclease/exonuclease/phosphatase family protein [Candidatus Brevibacterium intestinigallinarum]